MSSYKQKVEAVKTIRDMLDSFAVDPEDIRELYDAIETLTPTVHDVEPVRLTNREEAPDGYGFSALIEAFSIMRKYAPGLQFPTGGAHDVIYVSCDVDPGDLTAKDLARLEDLGWHWSEGNFQTFRFGSC